MKQMRFNKFTSNKTITLIIMQELVLTMDVNLLPKYYNILMRVVYMYWI